MHCATSPRYRFFFGLFLDIEADSKTVDLSWKSIEHKKFASETNHHWPLIDSYNWGSSSFVNNSTGADFQSVICGFPVFGMTPIGFLHPFWGTKPPVFLTRFSCPTTDGTFGRSKVSSAQQRHRRQDQLCGPAWGQRGDQIGCEDVNRHQM